VLPKPFQKPHPPLWVACSNIQTIANAGRWGMGALGFQFVSAEAARAWVHRYYWELTQNQARLADYPTNANIAMVSGFMCADTDEEALEKAAGWTFFVFCSATTDVTASQSRRREHVGGLPGVAPHRQGAGDAAQRTDRLARDHPQAGCASSRRPASIRSSC
jgi:alkanesulfonate monooxygenase SsuD/methylene tetrahydromethanopterin reductase-like flavin-dependent oxidoreductase (luciferase family)